MENLMVVKSQELLGKHFTIYGTIENPLFLAKDVATWIEHTNLTMMLKNVDSNEQIKISPKQSLGLLTSNNKYNFLTEDGLYEVLMQSRKPIAKQYKKEIKSILKQIRITGGYVQENRESEFIDNYFPSFTDSTKLSMVQDLRKKNDEYKNQIAQLTPQADAYKDLMTAQGYLQFLDVAGIVECKRNGLLEFLRNKKVLTKQSRFNVPYGRFKENGMFRVVCSRVNGHPTSVTLVSTTGLNYIYKLIKKSKMESEFNCDALITMSSKGSVA